MTVDPSGRCRRRGAERSRPTAGWTALFDSVEVAFGRESPGVEVIATIDSWRRPGGRRTSPARARRPGRRALPLPDPGVRAVHVPDGQPVRRWRDESYSFPHVALFSTEFLRDWFRARGLGVYAGGAAAGDAASVAFQNAITAVGPSRGGPAGAPDAQAALLRAAGGARRAQHVRARRARARPCGRAGRLRGDGSSTGSARSAPARPDRSSAAAPRWSSSPRRDQARLRASCSREHDVGLALMYTPHPSLAPIEMAAAGMLTVTNTLRDQDRGGARARSRPT